MGPLPFMIIVNDLQHVAKFLDPVVFADDSNLFYSNRNINEIFEIVNKELVKAIDWCFANKLSVTKS